MKQYKNLLALTLSTSFLVACGGGGSNNESSTNSNSPLSKYVGSYAYCDRDNTKYSLSITESNEKFFFNPLEETFQNSNCSGNIVAKYYFDAPFEANYTSTGISAIKSVDLPTSLEIDKIILLTQNKTARLTGTGVSGNCVTYPAGRFCYDLSTPTNINGGLYLKDSKLYDFTIENGVYENSASYTKIS